MNSFCFRRIDAKWNNQENKLWGAAGENLINLAPHAYADNISEPASACTRHHKLTKTCPYPKELSGVGSTRPSPREISNMLMTQVIFCVDKMILYNGERTVENHDWVLPYLIHILGSWHFRL